MHKKIILSSVLAMILMLTCAICGCGNPTADLSGGSMPAGGTTVITADEKILAAVSRSVQRKYGK